MSGIKAGLFRPGRHSVIASYTAAWASEACYPGDWVSLLAATVPGSQGVSGVYDGQSLTDVDYVEFEALDSGTAGSEGLALGCLMGPGIGSVANWEDVLPNVMADLDLAVIQCWGVHPQGSQLDSGNIGEHLAASTTAFEPGNAATIAGCDVGVNLIAPTTYQRAAAADTEGAVVWVRVGG